MISFSECKCHLQPHTLYWDKPQILLVLLQQLLQPIKLAKENIFLCNAFRSHFQYTFYFQKKQHQRDISPPVYYQYLCGQYISLIVVYVCRHSRLFRMETGQKGYRPCILSIFNVSETGMGYWRMGEWFLISILRISGKCFADNFAQTGIKLMLSLLPATAAIISMLFILFILYTKSK